MEGRAQLVWQESTRHRENQHSMVIARTVPRASTEMLQDKPVNHPATCTANSNSPFHSSVQTAYTCNTGYGDDTGTGNCTACVKYKYKTSEANYNCTDCVAGKYGNVTGQTTETSCTTFAGCVGSTLNGI
jgi:hypothetical protein